MSITYDQLADYLRRVAKEKSEWAGLPMPIKGMKLTIEPKFPFQYGDIFQDKEPKQRDDEGYTLVNKWWSERFRCFILLAKDKNGKIAYGKEPYNQGMMLLNTLGAIDAWQEETEIKAMEKLQSLVTPRAMKCYILTGQFLETSRRSNITYMFRKLRPTLAISTASGEAKLLCGLCSHTIGYYNGTWGGVLTPTDDVVAHLVYMRGDEKGFWKMCNQHPATMPQSGL